MSIQPLELYSFISALLERYRTIWALSRLHLAIPEDLPPLCADSSRLERILVNLISNALKYSAADAPVTIHAERSAREVILSVTDTGVGMDAEIQEQLFKPFFRAEATRRIKGIGLGLYITAQLVKAHGGRIWVKSAPGKGSTFFFSIPIYIADSHEDDLTGT